MSSESHSKWSYFLSWITFFVQVSISIQLIDAEGSTHASFKIIPIESCLNIKGTPSTKDHVLCDTSDDTRNWIFLQRRSIGDVDFYQTWSNYSNGFGELTGDFWLGLDKVYALCSNSKKPCELLITLHYNGSSYTAHYAHFSVTGPSDGYRLRVSSYSGTAGDELSAWNNGWPFSTWDRDSDGIRGNCAELNSAGWWFGACTGGNVNGRWGAQEPSGTFWQLVSGHDPVTYTDMKIRPHL